MPETILASLWKLAHRRNITRRVCDEVERERWAQDEKWGEQNHPDIDHPSGNAFFADLAERYKNLNDEAAWEGTSDWTGILLEEVYEALSESDPANLRKELVQAAAVAVSWIEAIDRRADRV